MSRLNIYINRFGYVEIYNFKISILNLVVFCPVLCAIRSQQHQITEANVISTFIENQTACGFEFRTFKMFEIAKKWTYKMTPSKFPHTKKIPNEKKNLLFIRPINIGICSELKYHLVNISWYPHDALHIANFLSELKCPNERMNERKKIEIKSLWFVLRLNLFKAAIINEYLQVILHRIGMECILRLIAINDKHLAKSFKQHRTLYSDFDNGISFCKQTQIF